MSDSARPIAPASIMATVVRTLLRVLTGTASPNLKNSAWLAAYALVSLAATLWVATDYFASMHSQLFFSRARVGMPGAPTTWSAPLDDVFIHFDFARASARGYPFEWSEGNGYSSGGTSLLYPFVLAAGYRFGFTGVSLMVWAGTLACVSVWATLWATRHFLSDFHPALRFVLPAALLSVGALNWSLFSGMEVAFFLAIWSLSALAWLHLIRLTEPARWLKQAGWLGAANIVLVATRPEAAVVVAVLCLSAVSILYAARPKAESNTRKGLGLLAFILLISAVPGACVIVGQAVANKLLTGDWSAAGAVVKLEMNHPYMTGVQMWEAWQGHFWYQFTRVTNYHFSDMILPLSTLIPGAPAGIVFSSGWCAWALALVGLTHTRTRRISIMLWLSMLAFMCVVGLNGQVRWQNERYTMPAVAWLLLNAGLGLAVLLSQLSAYAQLRLSSASAGSPLKRLARPSALALVGVALAALFVVGQARRARDQRWFFGRASRNIHDQHVEVGKKLRRMKQRPALVLLSDAGAIPYISDIPALDIIGLGGFKALPFARASNLGVGAIIELIQRLKPAARPDIMALYPSWWTDLPLWFGRRIWQTPVRGNVICGGASKVVYQPDWSALFFNPQPTGKTPDTRLVLDLDLADLVSEKAAHYSLEGAKGYVSMKVLPHPAQPKRDLWEGGRLLAQGSNLTFSVEPLQAHIATKVTLRVAPSQKSSLTLKAGGKELGSLHLAPSDKWVDHSFDLEPHQVDSRLELSIEAQRGATTVYHIWVTQ